MMQSDSELLVYMTVSSAHMLILDRDKHRERSLI